ncbi:MAG: type VI secretion system baseplate subunit TssF [Fibrobacteres bacterium]|nr:type VI secretion system baseplate subunit TssF [Fibrobacterota bacterium]
MEYRKRPDFWIRKVDDRGTTLLPSDKETADCRFSTTESLVLDHLCVQDARVETGEQGRAHLELRLGWKSSRTPQQWPDRIRFSCMATLPWCGRCGTASLDAKPAWRSTPGTGAWIATHQIRFKRHDAPGYGEDAAGVSPLADARDFLCCDERFRFVDLCGLGSFSVGEHPELAVRLHFEGGFPRGMSRGLDGQFPPPHCTISVNRYLETCQTLAWEHDRSEKILRPWAHPPAKSSTWCAWTG